MQPGNPGPGQDPYQQYPPGYGQVPQYSDPFAPGSPAAPQYPDPLAPGSPVAPQQPVQPTEYSLYPPVSGPPPDAYPQPQPQYPPAGYSVPPMMPAPMGGGQSNTLGLLSMIFGIISIPLLFCCYLGIPFGIAAIILGILGVGKANRGEANNKGMSMAGIITGAASIAILVILIVLYFAIGMSSLPSTTY